MNIYIIQDSKSGNPTEYYCNACNQLRLSLIDSKEICANCRSMDIITGKIGSLNKTILRKKYIQGKNKNE